MPRRVFLLAFLPAAFVLAGCGPTTTPPSDAARENADRQVTGQPESASPHLVDEKLYPANWVGDELDVQLCARKNFGALRELVGRNAAKDRAILNDRLADQTLSWDLRALYAAVLACQGQKAGQDFLAAAAGDLRSQRLGDAFWLMGNLTDLMPDDEQSATPNASALRESRNIGTLTFVPLVRQDVPLRPDMTWAVPAMLAAIADSRTCKQKLTWTDVLNKDRWGKKLDYPDWVVRDLALHYGGFHRLLTQLRCDEAVPLFCRYVLPVTEERQVAAPGLPLVSPAAADEVLGFLTSWETPEIERTLLEAARRAERRKYGARQVAIVLPWFLQRKKAEAIPLILNNLKEMDVYAAVVGTRHPPYLEAVRQALAGLQDGTLQGPALHDQRTARHHAELILIVGEEKDPVPKLMQFAAEPGNGYQRKFAVFQLHGRDDARIAPWADALIRREKDWYEPFALIELLGSLPDKDADRVLVELLTWDFRTVERQGAPIADGPAGYHKKVVQALERKTGQHIGLDPGRWREWMKQQPRERAQSPRRACE